ncbi:MAG: AAA family ATPase [Aestuariivita sp.]|nr:AAA family ATPase [Aestuariivita sp.]MCY4201639.1 AAA family ATPase [Aestuariivita sp.]
MNIEYLQISNILSFPFHHEVKDTQKIAFDSGLNIIIGENGSDKSTALEILNFLFKRVIYRQYNMNQELFARRHSISADDRRLTLQPTNQDSFSGFRMDPNWDNESDPQRIRICLRLDEIDRTNIEKIRNNFENLNRSAQLYSTHSLIGDGEISESYVVDVNLNRESGRFEVSFPEGNQDFGYQYLSEYHFFKESISIHNWLNLNEPIPQLYESFTLISSYRNYHAFEPSVTLKDSHPAQQIQQIKSQDYDQSINVSDKSEPPIFALVRLQVAECHFNLISRNMSEDECEVEANKLPFIVSINERLKVVNLKCQIKLLDLRTWQYRFEFIDLRRHRAISDINALSAGQKAIIHLVFEAYGRGDLKGGVVMIDEPEIHLHYQFQHEYLQVIDDLNREQQCQYILVTHSEALINSSTINNVRRFALTQDGYTEIFAPKLNSDQKSLIKILDNTRSTYAFFAKKVILVEGETDRYFYRAVLQKKHRSLEQEIAVLLVQGKFEFNRWRNLFETFGLQVFVIADFDYIVEQHYPKDRSTRLREAGDILSFKQSHPNWEQKITESITSSIFALKDGNLETYLNIGKDLAEVISFCQNDLDEFLSNSESSQTTKEVIKIFEEITQA